MLGTIISILTLFVTWMIPKRVMYLQMYWDLNKEYRSKEFGEAKKAMFDFFRDESGCNCDLKKVKECFINKINSDENSGTVFNFQRRLLSQYYYQLYETVSENLLGFTYVPDTMIKKDFPISEIDLLNILIEMDEVIDANPTVKNLKLTDSDFEKSNMTKGVINLRDFFEKILVKKEGQK